MKVLPSTLRSIILASVVSSESIHVAAQLEGSGIPEEFQLRYLKGDDASSCGAGVGIGIGNTFGQAVEGIARQPEMEEGIVQAGVIGAVLARSACEPIADIVNQDLLDALDELFDYFEARFSDSGRKKQLRV